MGTELRVQKSIRMASSFGSDARLLRHTLPLFDFRSDDSRVLLGRIADRVCTPFNKFFSHTRVMQRFHQRRVESFYNWPRHARRPKQAEAAVDDETRHARLLH